VKWLEQNVAAADIELMAAEVVVLGGPCGQAMAGRY
jgi:hypothetical protein